MKKIIEFLNTSLGIWLLSTIVVGVISFAYKSWKENSEDKKELKKQLTLINDEIDFRIRHVDRVFLNCKNNFEKYKKDEKTTKDELRSLTENVVKVTAIIDLGGISNIVQDKNSSCSILKSYPMHAQFLPFKSPYKDIELSTFSIEDLLNKNLRITTPKRKNKVHLDFSTIENAAFNPKEELIKNIRFKYNLSDATHNEQIEKTNELNSQITELEKWYKYNQNAWKQLKSEIENKLNTQSCRTNQ
jgi:hypothetical protein